MKKVLAALAILSVVAVAVLAAPTGMTVSTTAVKVLPGRPIRGGVTWTNGITLAQGQVVEYAGTYYMAEVAGAHTATPAPGGTNADDLRHVASGERIVAVVQNLGSTDVFLSFEGPAEADKGLKLSAGASATLNDVQSPVSAVTSSGSTTVGVTEVVR